MLNHDHIDNMNYIQWAKTAILTEAQALHHVAQALDHTFIQAVEAILASSGRVIVMGMGKSGHIGRKISATLASTGTPAFFVHPAEASHGDLGMIVDGDVVLALSNSGESDEILAIIPALKRKQISLICITSRPDSTMAKYADIHLQVAAPEEACPLGLAPTSSTTAVLAVGDALAISLLKARQFTRDDFALSHPAGSLGRRLLLTVGDVMHKNQELPSVTPETTLRAGIITMSEKGLGMLAIVDNAGVLQGILTDGDLRRLFSQYDKVTHLTVGEVMKPNPTTITENKLATEAVKLMQNKRISGLLVINNENERILIGALNMHDLLKARVV